MKKLLAFLLAVLVIASLGVSALAAVPTTDGTVELIDNSGLTDIKQEQTASMKVNLEVKESYTVTIPTSVTLTGTGTATGSAKISITPNLSEGKTVKVLMMNTGWSNPEFYKGADKVEGIGSITETHFSVGNIAYIVSSNFNNYTSVPNLNGVLVNSASGTTESDSILTFQAEAGNLSAGSHDYTQTFKIFVE